MKRKKTDTSLWDSKRGKIFSTKGGWVVGEAVYNQSYSMMDDLVGKVSYFQVLFLNAIGYLPEKKLADWLEALFICLSWPDHRVWCNQIGSLSGTLRTTPVTAVVAGILASDSRMYGPGTQHAGVTFITKALVLKEKGYTPSDIVKNYVEKHKTYILPGYVRPVASGDERVIAMKMVTDSLGFPTGEHLTLSFEIQDAMMELYNEGMNLLGFTSAFLCDQKLRAEEQYRLLSTIVTSGVGACYAETADNPPESFFPLRCDDIEYQGKPYRPVPDK